MDSNTSSADTCPTEPGLSRDGGFRPGIDWSFVKEHPDENWHVIGWLVCLVLLLVTWIVSIVTITKHLRNYYDPKIQRHKLRVLLFPPVYGTLAWFSYLRYDYSTTIMFFAVVFEAFAVFNLYASLQAYLQPFRDEVGNIKEAVDTKIMFVYKFHLKSKWGMHYRTITDFLVFQYPIWALIDAFMSIFAELKGRYCEGSYSFKGAYVYLTIINFISLSVILTALFTYLDVFHKDFKRGRIPSHGMFWCVKGPIVVIFYIGEVLLTILTTCGVIKGTSGVINPDDGTYLSVPWSADAVKNGIYVIIIAVTMFFDCFLMLKYFGPQDNIKKAVEKGQVEKMSYWKAFTDAYLAYIPQFLHMCFGCFVDSCALFKKRKQMKKRNQNDGTNPGLLTDENASSDHDQTIPMTQTNASQSSNVYNPNNPVVTMPEPQHGRPSEDYYYNPSNTNNHYYSNQQHTESNAYYNSNYNDNAYNSYNTHYNN